MVVPFLLMSFKLRFFLVIHELVIFRYKTFILIDLFFCCNSKTVGPRTAKSGIHPGAG